MSSGIFECPYLVKPSRKKNDDYIFYAKPENQRNPEADHLRRWYKRILGECQNRNIVVKVTNVCDQYFANPQLDATNVPYFDGDFFPEEAEKIIATLDSEEGGGKGDLDRDQVMVKLLEKFHTQKDNFMVAFLNSSNETKAIGDAFGNRRAATSIGDGSRVKIIDDDAEDLDCKILNIREYFLDMCRQNGLQFDQLRRAKHSTMVILWHLHNRDAGTLV